MMLEAKSIVGNSTSRNTLEPWVSVRPELAIKRQTLWA